MGRDRSPRALLRRHPTVADLVLGAAFGLAFLVAALAVPDAAWQGAPFDLRLTTPGMVVTVLAAAALTQWRRWRIACFAVLLALVVLCQVSDVSAPLAVVGLTLATYGCVVAATPRQATWVAVIATVAVLAANAVAGRWSDFERAVWLWTAIAVAVAVRSRRTTIAALEDRARRAEESREQTARRRVAEDRLRIARELHDVIAHHVAVVSVQAGVADHLVERDPAAAREALGHVRVASRAVLSELQSVLGVLRQEEAALPTAPAPGLAALAGLVATSRAAGVRVVTDLPDPLPTLTPGADLAAFRLVQEALTNVQKHAGGAPATVRVLVGPVDVLVEVANDPGPGVPAARPAGCGLGLVGMRERVHASGGSVTAGPTEAGGYRVAARFPHDAQEGR
jgi:signal transduction histidine kinase